MNLFVGFWKNTLIIYNFQLDFSLQNCEITKNCDVTERNKESKTVIKFGMKNTIKITYS